MEELKDKIIETLMASRLCILCDRRDEAWRTGMFKGKKNEHEKCVEWAEKHYKVINIEKLIKEIKEAS